MLGNGEISLVGEASEMSAESNVAHTHDSALVVQMEIESDKVTLLGKRDTDEMQCGGPWLCDGGRWYPLRPVPPLSRLFYAIAEDDLNSVQDIVESGLNLESRGELNNTPLIDASDKGKFDIVNFLLAKGADVNARGWAGKTSLINACLSKSRKSLDVIQSLIAAGADMNVQDKYGSTALLRSVQYSNDNIAMLLDNGADMNILNNKGWSAFMLANNMIYSGVKDYFIAHQAKLDQLALFIKNEFVDKAESDVKGKGYKFFDQFQRFSKNDLKLSCQNLGIADVDGAFAKVAQHISKHAAEINLIAKHPDGWFADTAGRRVTIPEDVMKHAFSYVKLSNIDHSRPSKKADERKPSGKERW
mgnify:FL=1